VLLLAGGHCPRLGGIRCMARLSGALLIFIVDAKSAWERCFVGEESAAETHVRSTWLGADKPVFDTE